MLSDSPDPVSGERRATWWHAVFEASEDALLVCARDGRLVESNRRAQNYFPAGSGPGEVLLYDALTPSTTNRLKGIIERDSRHPEILSSVSFLPGGDLRVIVDLVISRLDAAHWLITIKDATRRWGMESHVQRLMTALDATPDVFFLTDSDYKITYVNGAFQTVTGQTVEESLGRSAEFLRAPEEQRKIADYLRAIEVGADWMGEL